MTRQGEDEIFLEVDGPDVSPTTIDAPAFLELAAAFFQLLLANANELDAPLSLRSLAVVDKCVALRVATDRPAFARECIGLSLRQLKGTPAPRGLAHAVERTRLAVKRLPVGLSAGVLLGPKKLPLEVVELEQERPFDEVLAIRAEPIRVGGKSPAVRFRSMLEEDFTLSVTQDQARHLGAQLYTPVEIVARISRDGEGAIDGGTLLESQPLETREPREAWRAWFASLNVEKGATDRDR